MSITATITDSSIIITDRNDAGLVCETIAVNENRPASFAAADFWLAAQGYRVVGGWELGIGHTGLDAKVRKLDNVFAGVRAAGLWEKVGRTHGQFELTPASQVRNGDLVTDSDYSEVYLVAGSSTEGTVTKLHQVAEGKEWNERYTGEFHGLVWAARQHEVRPA
jgi:hypothetical protein